MVVASMISAASLRAGSILGETRSAEGRGVLAPKLGGRVGAILAQSQCAFICGHGQLPRFHPHAFASRLRAPRQHPVFQTYHPKRWEEVLKVVMHVPTFQ